MGSIGRCWKEWAKIFRGSFASLGPDVKRDLPPKQELQTATNHNKNALFDKQGCHTFANNESKTVIYPDLMDVLSRFEDTSIGQSRLLAVPLGHKKAQRQNSNCLIQAVVVQSCFQMLRDHCRVRGGVQQGAIGLMSPFYFWHCAFCFQSVAR